MPNDCLEKLREVKKLREEIIEKGLTPYLKIDVAEDVILPEHLKNQKEMILNISSSATELLVFSDDKVSFSCQFLGVEFEVTIPGQRILSCYEKETGIGQSWKDKSLEFEKAFAAFSKRTEESDFGTALTAYKTVLTTENDGLENSLQSADRAKRRLSVLGLWAPFLVKNKCYAEAVEICSDAFALLGDTWARPALPVESINPDAEAWLGLWASCLIHTGHYGKASDKYKLWFDLFYANRPDDEAKAKFYLNGSPLTLISEISITKK